MQVASSVILERVGQGTMVRAGVNPMLVGAIANALSLSRRTDYLLLFRFCRFLRSRFETDERAERATLLPSLSLNGSGLRRRRERRRRDQET